MDGTNATIFRAEAMHYRLQNQARRGSDVSLPRSMAVPVFLALWIALGVLAISGFAACFVRVMVPGTGIAIMTSAEGRVSVTALMPEKHAPHIHAGDSASVFLDGKTSSIAGTVSDEISDPLDPPAIEKALGLPASSLAMLDGAMVLVRVDVDPEADAALVPGTVGQAEMPVGTRPVGSFLPVIGQMFRSDI